LAKRRIRSFDDYEDKTEEWSEDEQLDKRIRKLTICGLIETGVLVLFFVLYMIVVSYEVKTVYVEGNEHYTAAEIRAMVVTGWFGDNSLFLSMKYRNKSITDIPFIEKMDVDVMDKNTIKITVYEKKLAGYVNYLGTYVYFDKDGIVVESSKVKTQGIPLVTGLEFDYFVMYEQLPVEDTKVFQTVLYITQLLEKYDIVTDRIFFSSDSEMTLYFGNVRVDMGKTDLLEEKVQRLDAILPELEGMSGLLDMGAYDSGNENFTFTID